MKEFLLKFQSNNTVRIILVAGLVLILTYLLPTVTTIDYDYQIGSIWIDQDVIASFAFPVYRDIESYEPERQLAMKNTIRSFDRVDTVTRIVLSNAKILFTYIRKVCDKEIDFRNTPVSPDYARFIHDSLRNAIIPTFSSLPIDAADWLRLISIRDNKKNKKYTGISLADLQGFIEQQALSILKIGYLDKLKSDFTKSTLAIQEGKQERIRSIAQFIDWNDVDSLIKEQFIAAHPGQDSLVKTVEKIFLFLLKPNIIFNQERTQIAIDWNVDHVPRTSGIVKENERIISKHDRVTPEIKAKLDSYRKAKIERSGHINVVLVTIGKAGLIILILFILAVYLYQFRKKIFYDNARLLAISILIILEGLLTHLTFSLNTSIPIQYFIVVPTASMLLTIMFDSRVGLNGTVVIALLVGAIRGNDYSIMLASLAAGAISVYTVRDIKNRIQIFRSLAFIFLAYAFTIVILGLQRYADSSIIVHELLFAFGNSILSPVFTYGLLVFFERVFGITTDLTLLELSDFNHPLLRNLSTQAPGTFHHSIVMGTLAEAAAKAIGANPTLARVGAYYHDIGKIAEAEFFVENQLGTANVHEGLDPKESSKHIINHVLYGIDIGNQYNLPQRIIDFIPAHHGKGIVSYFYEKEKRKNPDTDVDDFTYPGPRPQTKETGIVMLVDTIEAAARALEDPTIEQIDKLIKEIMKKRLDSGDLDECDLTMRDLNEIEKCFLGILAGIHHSRIKYPSQEEEEEARKNAERTAKLLRLPSTIEMLARRMKKIDAS